MADPVGPFPHKTRKFSITRVPTYYVFILKTNEAWGDCDNTPLRVSAEVPDVNSFIPN